MSDKSAEGETELEREVRMARRFTPEEALARMAGPGAMKGASPVSRERQAEIEIGSWLGDHLDDDAGALKLVLQRQIKGSRLLLDNIESPLTALAESCRRTIASDELLKELVRETDVEWGRRMDERPHFERTGMPADPSDPYTVVSVRKALNQILEKLPSDEP